MKRVVYLVLATLVLLEATLQLIAVSLHLMWAPSVKSDGRAEVLCIGDSFTFGDGASSPEHSYPAVLQQLLRKQRPDIRVENAGWPGRDSGDVLSRLDDLVQQVKPKVVCVLVGCNDQWNLPKLQADSSSGDEGTQPNRKRGFEWRWRTARLARIILKGQGALQDQRPEASKQQPLQPAVNTASEREPPTAEMIAAARVLVEAAGFPLAKQPPTYVVPAAAEIEAIEAAKRTIWSGDSSKGLAMLQEVLARTPNEPTGLRWSVDAALRLGRQDLAKQSLASLEQASSEKPGANSALPLAEALWVQGRADDAYEIIQRVTQENPQMIEAWRLLATIEMRRDENKAVAALQKLMSLADNVGPHLAVDVADLGRGLRASQPSIGAKLLLAGLLLDGRVGGHAWGCLVVASKQIGEDTIRRATSGLALDTRGQALVNEAIAQTFGASNKWQGVLVQHLITVAKRARSSGAEVVFLSYPSLSAVELAQAEAATSCKADFVLIRERFDSELTKRPRHELFVSDGHCNDAGYALMAEIVSPVIARLLD